MKDQSGFTNVICFHIYIYLSYCNMTLDMQRLWAANCSTRNLIIIAYQRHQFDCMGD